MSSDKVKRYIEIWWKGIKSLPETTSIHGFRFIADSKRHWIERVFWLILVMLSWYGSSMLIEAQYRAFQNNPISFVVDTSYKDWNTQFPSVAVCELDNTLRIENVSDSLWGPYHDFNLEEILKELSFFKGVTYYISDYCGNDDPIEECFKSNLNYYANLIRHSCEEIIFNCTWNGKLFDCCTYFRSMDTEFGPCFVINSIQGSSKPKLEMVSNRTTGPGVIKFDVKIPVKVYILNEEEVPSLTALGTDVMMISLEHNYRRYITIRNIDNDASARLIRPEKRKCRYSDENILTVYPYYSYTACTVQCRKDAQIKHCNCSNFFMPNTPEEEKCNMSGIICLNNNMQNLSVCCTCGMKNQYLNTGISKRDSFQPSNRVLKARWSKDSGLYCDCLPSCTEAEISIVKDFKALNNKTYSTVAIELSMLPNERYRRNVVRGVLDLVVSTGGTGGLFLGASILSFVELLYILLIRPFCDIYSQRNDDPWHKKYGNQRIEDNKFKLEKSK